jgi:hopanoid-associated sugar epimerase
MGKILVTGGSGHVGANLVRALLQRGEAVRALERPNSDNRALADLDLERVDGDVRDPASLARAMAGCDRVYHLAACVSLRAGDRHEIFEVNVVGTRNLLGAAERAGVRRVVVCSSFGAVGVDPSGRPSDETCTVNPFDTHLDYELSKGIAEIEVHRAVSRGLDAVIVNPCGIVGPYDFRPSSVGQTILDFAARRMPAYVAGAFEFVPVKDVVAGHLLAMENGRTGERYILGSEHKTIDEILLHLERITGAPRPRVRLPVGVMMPIAVVSSAVMKRFFPTRPPRFTPGTIKLLQSEKRADLSKARRELGYQPTSVLEAFTQSYEWFRERGLA